MRKGSAAGRLVGRTESKTIVVGAYKSSGHGCNVMPERLAEDRVHRALWATMNGVLWHPLVIRTTTRRSLGREVLGSVSSVLRYSHLPQRLVCMQYTWPRTWSRSICELSVVFILGPGVR